MTRGKKPEDGFPTPGQADPDTVARAFAPPAAPAPITREEIAQMIADASAMAFERGKAAGIASVPTLPDDQIQAQKRRAAQFEAAKREHPIQSGALRHLQSLRDGTVVHGIKDQKASKDAGEDVFMETPIAYRNTPDGKVIVGGQWDGKYL
jgi:hypothetical protein